MITDRDVYRAAKLLIDHKGEDAAAYAVERANALFDEGDLEGATVWKVILAAVLQLQRERPAGDALN